MKNLTVKEFFSAIPKNETVYYRSNPGNAGDALIATGTFHLFDDLGINIQFINPETFDATDKIVVYAGGGNFNHIYPEARDFLSRHHKSAKQLILLPHTITENADLLGEFGDNVTLFAREWVSYGHIKNHAAKCHTYIDHDMAMHIDTQRIFAQQHNSKLGSIAKKVTHKLIGKNSNDQLPSISKMKEIIEFERSFDPYNAKVGNFFRNDVEASGRPIPENNADLSVIYELSTRSREIIEYTVWLLLNYIDRYETVSTDRLHICVAASLLKKPVKFYGNSYFKCRAVYEYTLSEAFEQIEWILEE